MQFLSVLFRVRAIFDVIEYYLLPVFFGNEFAFAEEIRIVSATAKTEAVSLLVHLSSDIPNHKG